MPIAEQFIPFYIDNVLYLFLSVLIMTFIGTFCCISFTVSCSCSLPLFYPSCPISIYLSLDSTNEQKFEIFLSILPHPPLLRHSCSLIVFLIYFCFQNNLKFKKIEKLIPWFPNPIIPLISMPNASVSELILTCSYHIKPILSPQFLSLSLTLTFFSNIPPRDSQYFKLLCVSLVCS